jgi:hypothetical protein
MILDDYKTELWFGMLGEVALTGKGQFFIQSQLDELNNVINEQAPFGIEANLYHDRMTSLFAKKELLQQQLEFFKNLKEEFEKQSRSD